MSKRNWTSDQLLAIKTKYRKNGESCNLLLSAAAGSGKTAVLVERVIQKILPEDAEKGIDIDKLLIVTFTNAAAREMSDRIAAALSSELENAIENGDTQKVKLIKRQQLLLGISQITTIDSFCLKLIREHFNVLGIEPDFAIADTSLAEILSEEALDELFSSLYEENNEEFLHLLSVYATSRSDKGLSDLVRHIYNFTRAIPYPTDWLYSRVDQLKCPNGIFETMWFKVGFQACKKALSDALEFSKKGLYMICETPDIDSFIANNPPEKNVPVYDEWKAYYKAFYYDYLLLKEVQDADFTRLSHLLHDFSFSSLARLDSKSDEEKGILKALRERVKSAISKAREFAIFDPQETETQMRNVLYPTALALAGLVVKYDDLFTKKKLEKNILEFHDAEQLTAKLLSENPDIARLVQEKYDEILMDEYQDTSLLQEEIFRHVTRGNNLFMVGDMKQSIYRFRNSDPTIFKAKSDTYEMAEDAHNRKIILSKNFRSRSEVLDSVNDIFQAIMSEDAGELDYDETQRLYTGNESYENVNPSYLSECFIIEAPPSDYEPEDDEDVTNPALEARLVAEEINKLKREHFKVFDGKSYRDIQNRDIVILMSSFKYSADSYMAELQNAGIDCFAESSGYFERSEVVTILALLKTLCNPYSDIPLLAIMRSPIGNFTDDELATIRTFKKGNFFGAVKEIAENEKDEKELSEKAAAFISKINRWREYSRYMSSDKLLWQLYEESDFYAYSGAIPDGDEAQANLRLLFERAKQYEAGGFEGLFNFVRYMEHVEQKDADLSSAKLIGESHNVVRIMTIHKSKGLEFPVVFITGGGKRFNKSSSDGRVLLHKDLGVAPEFVDENMGFRAETMQRAVFKNVASAEQISEEIRKLYVATTRAKEKLYFVATVSGNTDKSGKTNLEKQMEDWRGMISEDGPDFSANDVLSASGFSDWVAPVAIASDNWKFTAVNHTQIGSSYFEDGKTPECEAPTFDPVNILSYTYPYKDVATLPTKVSVSQLKSEKETVIAPKPAFLCEKEISGASYGTTLHKLMQHIRPTEDISRDKVIALADQLVSLKVITEKEAKTVNPDKIADFYASPLGKRIIASDKVYREQPFEVEIDVSLAYPDLKDTNEKILLQGVIDCFFEEDDGLVLVDYKTDRYDDVSEIHEKYDRQLELYKYALEKITKKTVKESYIYLFSTGTYIK
ncbi:MAG: helicase-exonuclease AddAB subunit AddA [Clostridia bacterium]|nr:helicase-exonuclease AddAB subunit AddA [Clostridia bacterium]